MGDQTEKAAWHATLIPCLGEGRLDNPVRHCHHGLCVFNFHLADDLFGVTVAHLFDFVKDAVALTFTPPPWTTTLQ